MTIRAARVHAIEERLQKAAAELRQIQDLLVAEDELDGRILGDFRDAINKVRAVTWTMEQYAKAQASAEAVQKVLVADDSRFQVEILTRFLSDQGYVVASACDGLQAWTTAVRAQPDIIVLDLNMPAGSGVDVLKKLKMSTKTASIPVIGITGSSDAAAEQNMTASGAAAFLTKPLDLERLHRVITQLLAKRFQGKAQTV